MQMYFCLLISTTVGKVSTDVLQVGVPGRQLPSCMRTRLVTARSCLRRQARRGRKEGRFLEAESRRLNARGRKLEAASRKPEVGSRNSGADDGKSGAGSRRLQARELEADDRTLGTGNQSGTEKNVDEA